MCENTSNFDCINTKRKSNFEKKNYDRVQNLKRMSVGGVSEIQKV